MAGPSREAGGTAGEEESTAGARVDGTLAPTGMVGDGA